MTDREKAPSSSGADRALEIPNKSSFKFDEVCRLTKIKPYVLRFWESEFYDIAPITSASGQKIYEHKDIKVIQRIKNLLIDQKLSIEKAKAILLKKAQGPEIDRNDTFPNIENPQKLVLAKAKLHDIISKTQSMQNFLNEL